MSKTHQISGKELRNWRLLEAFVEALEPIAAAHPAHRSFADPRRQLDMASYLGLFLLGVFNSCITTMRQLCAATELEKVQKALGAGRVSLGSFSAVQHLLEPDLLRHVLESLVERLPVSAADPRLAALQLIAQDGTLFRALPRMAWAQYGVGPQGQAKGVRVHVRFNLLKGAPEDALITAGKGSETAALREMLLPGQTTVADRLYGKDYKLFSQIDQARAFFVFRLHNVSVFEAEELLALSQQARAAGVEQDAWGYLGATEQLRSMRVRVVQIQAQGETLLLATNLPPKENPAELISLIYRRRWQIELYFRWIKCILGARHFFAESPEGVSIQIYLALIASVLLQLYTGARPNKRVMEFLQMHFMGWASLEELQRLIPKYSGQNAPAKKR